MWTVLKSIIFNNFMFGILAEPVGSLAPQSGIKSTLPAVEGKILTTGRPKEGPTQCKMVLNIV